MRKPELTLPQLLFVVGTRAVLAGGVAFLISQRLDAKQRKLLGAAMVAIGAVTTVPAAMMVFGTHDHAPDKIETA
jgi:hypothetical protein